MWPVGWRGTAQGCASDRIAAIAPCGGLRSTARVPWLGRAAQAARPTQGARRPRPTPHPVPAHAAARTQRPICPPARVPRAPREPPSALARSPALAHRCAINSGEGRRRRGAAWRARCRQAVEWCGLDPRAPSRAAGGARVVLESRAWPAGGGRRYVRMRLSVRFSHFGSRSSAVAASPVSCSKIVI